MRRWGLVAVVRTEAVELRSAVHRESRRPDAARPAAAGRGEAEAEAAVLTPGDRYGPVGVLSTDPMRLHPVDEVVVVPICGVNVYGVRHDE